jgi:hypothetical protein
VSHASVRILAIRLDSTAEGVNAVALQSDMPRFDDGLNPDAAPPNVFVYDETRHPFVARRVMPKRDVGAVNYPCIIVFLQAIQYDSYVPKVQSTGARTIEGRATIVAQLLLNDSETELAVCDGMYLLRAMRGAIILFDQPGNEDERTAVGVRLSPCESIVQALIEAPEGDSILSPGSLVLTYPFIETVPLPAFS